MVIPGTINTGTPLWQASHTIPISLGILDWEWYGNSMGSLPFQGGPMSLGVPENPTDFMPWRLSSRVSGGEVLQVAITGWPS